jgi:hypothetical protein
MRSHSKLILRHAGGDGSVQEQRTRWFRRSMTALSKQADSRHCGYTPPQPCPRAAAISSTIRKSPRHGHMRHAAASGGAQPAERGQTVRSGHKDSARILILMGFGRHVSIQRAGYMKCPPLRAGDGTALPGHAVHSAAAQARDFAVA